MSRTGRGCRATVGGSGRGLLAKPFTRAGAVVGTPLYMAPEQREGRADERSDQFSFCRLALELLHGVDVRSIARGTRGSPAWSKGALERGLATDPAARYPSMQALIDALEHDPTAMRQRILGIAGVVGLLGAAAFCVTWYAGRATRVCRGAEAKLAGVVVGRLEEDPDLFWHLQTERVALTEWSARYRRSLGPAGAAPAAAAELALEAAWPDHPTTRALTMR